MTNSKLIFKATDIFDTVLAQEVFTVQHSGFCVFSDFIQKEHKAFIEYVREQFSDKEHVYTNYYVRECSENDVNVILG